MIPPYKCIAILLFVLMAGNVNAKPSVLFDQGHSQAFLVENSGELDLSKLADVFREEGVDVATSNSPINMEELAGVDGLIISGPFRALSKEEDAAVVEFVRGGGRVSLMLHIAQPLAALMMDMGVMHSNGVVREQDNRIDDNITDFFAATSGTHQIVSGLDRFALYGAWAVAGIGDDVKEIAATGAHGWVDLNKDGILNTGDVMQKLSVAVSGNIGQGEFVVFGDDAIFQNKFLVNENEKLARNLAHWISHDKGDK